MPSHDTFMKIILGIDHYSRSSIATSSTGKVLRGIKELFADGHYAVAESNIAVVQDMMTRIDTTILGDYEVMFGPKDTHRGQPRSQVLPGPAHS